MRILLAAFCLIAFVLTWLAMGISLALGFLFPPDVPLADRIRIGLQKSISGELPIGATFLCTFNALTQYGFRHFIRRIIEEDDPDPPGGFRWVRALQSVLIAWALWYATLIAHCLK